MGRADKRSGTHHHETEASDWLAGRRLPGVRQLLEAIHAINPTGLDLDARETARRYILKSRLQSLLVRRFGEELRVQEDAPGFVLLQHRPSGSSAGHARVAELEEDARSWVLFQVDVADAPEPAPDVPARGEREDPEACADPLRDAQEALGNYDFERARELLRLAFHRSGGAAETAVPYLEFLVDSVADHAAALDLADQVAPAVAQREDVRGLLGLAAAREGQEHRAARWVQDLRGVRAAEVRAVLVDRALLRKDLDAASQHLAALPQTGVVHPELPLLEKRRALLEREALAPLEAELEELQRAGQVDAVAARAQTLLERWPANRVARALLAHVESQRVQQLARQRSQDAAELLARARNLAAESALPLLEEAARQDADLPGLRDALQHVREVLHQQREAAQVEACLHLLELDLHAGLLALLDLPEPLRSRVPPRCPRPEPAWLMEVASVPAPRVRLVDAALAVGAAVVALHAGDVAETQRQLAASADVLRGTAVAARIHADVAAWEQLQRRTAVQGALDQVEGALARGDLARAGDVLDGLGEPWPEDALHARAEALRARWSQARRWTHTEQRFAGHRQAREPLEAWVAARELTELAVDPVVQGHWLEQAAQQHAAVRKEWKLRVAQLPPEGVEVPLDEEAWVDLSSPGVRHVLSETGQTVFMVELRERWLFIREFCVRTLRLQRAAWLQLPKDSTLTCWHVHDGLLTLLLSYQYVLVLRRDPWDVLEWRDTATLVPGTDHCSAICPVPGTPYLWVERFSSGDAQFCVVDRERWALCRIITGPRFLKLVPGPHGPYVALLAQAERGVRLYLPNGDPCPMHFPPGIDLKGLVAHPSGRGWLVLAQRGWTRRKDPETSVGEWGVEGGNSYVSHGLRGVTTISYSALVPVAPDRVHVLVNRQENGRALSLGPRLPAGELAPVPAAGLVPVLTDCLHRHHWVASVERGRPQLTPFPPDPATVTFQHPELWGYLRPSMFPPFISCQLVPKPRVMEGYELHDEFYRQPEAQREAWLRAQYAARAKDPEALQVLLGVLAHGVRDRWMDALYRQAGEAYPQHAGLQLLAINREVGTAPWPGLMERLKRLDATKLDREVRQHWWHLMGVACLWAEDSAHAATAFREATLLASGDRYTEGCQLEGCMALAQPVTLPLVPADGAEAPPMVAVFRCALELADQCLARGDFSGARAALDRVEVESAQELQSQARLAEAYLHSRAADDAQRLRKAMALAQFPVGVHEHEGLQHWSIPLGARHWPPERLADVAARAEAWLAGDQDGRPL